MTPTDVQLMEAQVRLAAAARWLEHAAAHESDVAESVNAADRLVVEARRWLTGDVA